MLQVTNLACARGERLLFENFSFALKPGELLHLLGANGSGKTTLLRTLCGLSLPQAGDITWQGTGIRVLQEEYRRKVCYIGHSNGLQGELTAVENLRFAARLAQAPLTSIDGILRRLALSGIAHLPSKLLSQGQKRRLALARLLVGKQPLWILDEPFTALDSTSCSLMVKVLTTHIQRGGMAVVTSHQTFKLGKQRLRKINLDTR